MKAVLRVVLSLIAVAGAAAIVVWLRQREAPAPAAGLPGRPAPKATPAPRPPATAEPDDLAEVRGIGPVYRGRLAEAGITTFARLAAAEPAAVVDATGVTPRRAADWITQAAALAAH